MPKHPITHVEFSSTDRQASKQFYQAVFDWTFKDYDEMNYTTFNTGEGVGGGFNPVSDHNPAGTVSVYIQTNDIAATLEKVEAAGGKTVVPATEIAGTGKFGSFRDPSGNVIGLMQWDEPSG